MEAPVSAQQLRTRARIAAHALWDSLIRPEALRPDEVPWHAEAIGPAWITAVLGRGVPGARAEAVTVSGGDQGSSLRRAVAIQWNAAGTTA
ncbi:MAG: hypothetical protein GC201_14445, partial [Alphaproteobacteria bacterium]|nr:hypothetical protein [Alphaproteobacteria bacterium]